MIFHPPLSMLQVQVMQSMLAQVILSLLKHCHNLLIVSIKDNLPKNFSTIKLIFTISVSISDDNCFLNYRDYK